MLLYIKYMLYINSVSFSSSNISQIYQDNRIDLEYLRIKKELINAGISPSGDKDEDMRLYYQLQVEKAQETQYAMLGKLQDIGRSTTSQDTSDVPWASFMQELGLAPTGDLNTDKEIAIAELEERIKEATYEVDQTYYMQLAEELDEVFKNRETAVILDYTTASQYISEYNRFMIFNS